MKRKHIKDAVEMAKAQGAKVREKAEIYLNVLEFVWGVSDRERCDYYDAITLYIMYGIAPNFDTFSATKMQQFRLIFSLLKKQRIGFENATKSNSYNNFAYGGKLQATPDTSNKEISNKDIKNKVKELFENE